MLINITNHPSNMWSENQINAAKKYGEIFDMPFPNIDATANEKQISKLADQYLQKILNISKEKSITVHLMGELTFTYALLKRLQQHGICCVASTSCRIVKKETSGHKEDVYFEFERFRIYESVI